MSCSLIYLGEIKKDIQGEKRCMEFIPDTRTLKDKVKEMKPEGNKRNIFKFKGSVLDFKKYINEIYRKKNLQ